LRQAHNYYNRASNETIPSIHIEEDNTIETNEDNNHRDIEPPTKKQRAEWILKIKETNKLTQSCTENILSYVSHLCSSIITDLTAEVKRKLAAHNLPPDVNQDIIKVIRTPILSKI